MDIKVPTPQDRENLVRGIEPLICCESCEIRFAEVLSDCDAMICGGCYSQELGML